MNYHEIEEKGQGGFAKVFIVEGEDGKRYAKKVFAPQTYLVDAVGEEHLKKRFIREVKYQSTIKHNNVVEIVEHALNNDPPEFIMPLAECTLSDQIQDDPTLGGSPKKPLFDILAGLEAVHDKGFVHRDLKPANILKFIPLSDTETYAISDFGLMMASQSNSSTLTGTNAGGGTENYSAPELIRGLRHATPAADIYSFGAILHDIFGGGTTRIPYTELSLPGEIGEIVAKCTKQLTIRRYKTVAALREDLYKVLDDEEITFTSSKEEAIVTFLGSETTITDEQWDSIFILIQDNLDEGLTNKNIFSAITEDHISSLLNHAPDLFTALGHYFSEYIQNGEFDFNYCDILASKAEIFFNDGDLGLQSEVAIALLLLGTSHNRWYVERKFVEMANNNISDALAERIKTEIEVLGIDFLAHICHVEVSINFDKENLHPVLLEMIQ